MSRPPFAEREGRPADAAHAARRAGMAQAAESGVWRVDPPPRALMPGGVRALVFDPPGAARGTLIHLHGGGYRLGCPEMISAYAAALAARCGVRVICPAYRLAPEHPFPAALNDAWRVWSALRDDGLPIIVAGDSAGGGLAASLTALAVESGEAPAGLVLLSAWLDLSVTSACYRENAATDPLFSHASAREAANLYLQGHDPADPRASPLLATLDGFPPTLVSIGSGEVLADDGRRFHAALQDAGVQAALVEVDGMEHVAVTRGMELTGATETFKAIVAFVEGVAESSN